MQANQWKHSFMAVLAACLTVCAPALHATLPHMYPTFSTASTITNVNLYGTIASTDDMMAETTLQGAYNQLQGSNRLFISSDAQDVWWLQQSVPSTVTVSTLSWTQTDPDGALKAMLSAYGSSIKGYYICDPENNPESCNMATTLAGINDAMVVYPDNLTVMSGYSVPLMANGDLRNVSAPTGSQYVWVGSTASLVGDTTINQISTPGGGSGGTTGWGTNCASGQTLGTATYLSVSNAIKWTSLANEGTGCTALYNPGAGALGKDNYYVFSVQVAGSGTVFLDAWTGEHDVQSSSVTLNSTGWQTLQLTVPIPSDDNANPVQLQVRANTTGNAVTCYIINAAVVQSRIAVDQYQYTNLISSTNSLAQAILSLDSYNDRDYYIASKMFVYYVGSSGGTGEKTLFDNILSHWAAMTPILGYPVNETSDVADLSAAGYFINVSDKHRNGSVWASLPGSSSFTQPAPTGIKAQNGYVYVGMFQSDGDNTSFMYNLIRDKFATDQWLGAVPLGWTTSPATLTFWPHMYSYYYAHVPQSNEIMAGPSGVGYTTDMSGSNLTTLASLSNQFMTALDQSTVFSYETNPTDILNFATDLNLPHVMPNVAYAFTQVSNSAGTIIDSGGPIGFNSSPATLYSTIQNWVSSNCVSTAPCFVDAQSINGYIWPSDLLWVAEQLELNKASGQEYVFLTPSELAATWKNYHNSGSITATSNAQALPGATLLASYPQNYVHNPSGLDMTNMTGLFTLATTGNHESLMFDNYQGLTRYFEPSDGRIQLMTTNGNTTNDVIASAPINTVPWAGGTYDFQMQVAGSGTAKIGVYNGSTWTYSSTVTLTSSWQTLNVISAAPASGGKVEVIIPAQTAAVTLHFASLTYVPSGGWNMDSVVSGSTEDLTNTTYNYTPALLFTMSGSQGHTQEIAESTLPLKASTSYVWSVDAAGSGGAHLLAYEGGNLCTSSTVTLTTGYQTLTCTGSTTSSGTPGLFVVASVSSSAQTIYIRNASVVPAASLGTTDFTTGLETGQTQPTWSNTVDTTAPGGNESNVSSAVLDVTTSAMSQGGSSAIQYSGTASGGTTNYAYMKVFSNSTTLSSTSRLSYWIYPQTPNGAEPGASSTTGLNSTCAAIDIIFTDGTALRNFTAVTDQYGNQMHPAHMCGHLQPDAWNYVTTDLSSLSGKTISRIDVGYDQPSAPAGNYSGYVDNITLKH